MKSNNERATLNTPFAGWSDGQMDKNGNDILTGIQGSEYFSGIPDVIADYKTNYDAYRAALGKASTRDKNAIQAKNSAKNVLIDSLFSLTSAVMQIADGNIEILTESNLPVRKKRQPVQPQAPEGLMLSAGLVNGSINGKVKNVKGKRILFVAYTADPLTEKSEWTTINSIKSSFIINSLPSGSKVWVKVGAVTSANITLWSEAILSPYIP